MGRMGSWMPVALWGALCLSQATRAEAQAANYLDQGWSGTDRQYFYRTTQGSRVMSYRVLTKLEKATSTERFMSQANLGPMGFLFEDGYSSTNPDGLPIGVVKDAPYGKMEALGLTCAACHTRDVVVKNWLGFSQRYRIDGAQSQVDMERFLRELEAALQATVNDSAKLQRLLQVLGAPLEPRRSEVIAELNAGLARVTRERMSNMPADGVNNPGPGRLDALGHIKSTIAETVYPGSTSAGGPSAAVNATAPVSYPFLWDSPYQDFVQWPSNAPNANGLSLGRNIGEVIGVFAETKVTRNTLLGTYSVTTSADIGNLVELEKKVMKLKSPLWPSAQSPINASLAAQGDALFQAHCVSCHEEVPREPRTEFVPTYAVSAAHVGTDPAQTQNNLELIASGALASNKATPINGLEALEKVVGTLMLKEVAWLPFVGDHKQAGAPSKPLTIPEGAPALSTYKSRPLNGIWATGPFLHNGSVRTLNDLLLPASQRPQTFCVGSLELDTANVGMKNDCSLPGAYLFSTSIPGNKATGHEYGTGLSATQRAALVEYMKTL